MFWPQETLRLLPRNLVHSVDVQDVPAPLRGLTRPADHDARLHRRVVEEVRPKAEDALEQVGLDELAAHLGLFVAEEHAVREEDRAPTTLGVKALQDVLEERVVGPTLRRRAEEVAAPWVV